MLTVWYTRYSDKLPAVMLLAVYLMIGVMQLQTYFPWQSVGFLLSLMAMVVVFRVNPLRVGSTRCGWITLLFLLLSWRLPVFTLRYATLITAIFFVVEYFYGRLHLLTFITAVFITPAMDYGANVFSFPLRLWLTGTAGKLLAAVNPAITTAGNMIIMGNNEFSVDPACMGLQMMITSLLCGIMLIALYQRRYGKILPAYLVGVVLTVIILLNIVANLFRIILLVQFVLPAGSPAHEAVGILSLLVYVILPLLWGVRWLLNRFGKTIENNSGSSDACTYGLLLQLVLAAGIIGLCYVFPGKKAPGTSAAGQVKALAGYTVTTTDDHIVKQTAADALLYIKPIPGFYFTDHQPMICWKGSGFEFYKVQEVNIQGVNVYTAELKKDNSILYTAWWYENRVHRSSSQLEWRWDALCSGNNYFLVNLTVAKQALLESKIKTLLQMHLIQ